MTSKNSPGTCKHVCQWKIELRHPAILNERLYTFPDFWDQVKERRAEENASAEAK